MSDYDRLAEEQSKQGMATEDPVDSLNAAALGDQSRPVANSTKRKLRNLAGVQASPNKRLKETKAKAKPVNAIAAAKSPKATKAAPGKLGRTRKAALRQNVDTRSMGKKPKGDVFIFPEDISETQPPRSSIHPETQKPDEEAAQMQTNGHTVESAKPTTRQLRASVRSRAEPSASTALGSKEAPPSGSNNNTGRPKRKRGRPAKEKSSTTEQSSPKSPVNKSPPSQSQAGDQSVEPVVSEHTQLKETSPHLLQHERGESGERDDKDIVTEQEDSRKSNEADSDSDSDDIIEDSEDQGSNHEESQHTRNSSKDEVNSEDEDDGIQVHMDLLGEETNWKKVLASARSVHKIRLKLATKTIKGLVLNVEKAKSKYKEILEEMDDGRNDTFNEQLSDLLEVIKNQIWSIKEENEPSKRPKVIQDIYGRAIPATVFLLESALKVRASVPPGLHNYQRIAEIVRLQGIMVELCERAKLWKAKPKSSHPIVKPTKSVILPYLRNIREVFVLELKAQKRLEKIKLNKRITAQKEKQRQEQSQREAGPLLPQDGLRDRQWRKLHLKEEFQRHVSKHVPRFRLVERNSSIRSAQRPSPIRHHTWTEADIGELLVQLKHTRDYTGKERWLGMLNTPLLQNMLPERVREKALSLKPDFIEQLGFLPWLCNIE